MRLRSPFRKCRRRSSNVASRQFVCWNEPHLTPRAGADSIGAAKRMTSPQRINLAAIERLPIIAVSIREGAMLSALFWIGEILVGASIVSTGWLLSSFLLDALGRARRRVASPTYHSTSAGTQ